MSGGGYIILSIKRSEWLGPKKSLFNGYRRQLSDSEVAGVCSSSFSSNTAGIKNVNKY